MFVNVGPLSPHGSPYRDGNALSDVAVTFVLPVPLCQVIYALNTKNDEHEAAIATLKEAHEEEVQQILSETREKILQVCTLLR